MSLSGSRVLVLAADFFEESELIYPVHRLREEGAEVVVASVGGGMVTGKSGLRHPVDADVALLSTAGFAGVVVPGGFAPDLLRRSPDVLDLVRSFDTADKPVAMICHAGWVGISAEIVKGRRVTSVPAIRIDLENAGATWVDEPAVIDGNLVTARVPADLGPWMRAVISLLS